MSGASDARTAVSTAKIWAVAGAETISNRAAADAPNATTFATNVAMAATCAATAI